MRNDVPNRQDQILVLLQEHGSMSPAELAAALGVAPVTVRRDIAKLAEVGRISRAHGRAMPIAPIPQTLRAGPPPLPPFTVGMLVPRPGYYYGDVIQAAKHVIAAAGGRMVLGVSNDRAAEDESQIRALLDAGADALIATPSWPDGAASDSESSLGRAPVPVVLVERRGNPGSTLESLDSVGSDHSYGARLAVGHLVEQGWRDIILILQPTPTSAQLRIGYEQAANQHGLTVRADMIVHSVTPEEDPAGGASIADVLERRLRESGPFAAVVHNDLNALMIMQRLQSRGVRVPEDVGFVAYDDETAEFADVPLTAISPPKSEVGRRAAEMIVERLSLGHASDDATASHTLLLPRLNVRASSRHPAGHR